MRSRLLPLALGGATVIALALTGCSDGPGMTTSSDSANGAGNGSGAGAGTTSIQFVNPLPNYPAWRLIGDCMADAAEARGVDFNESGPTGQAMDPTTMIEQIQSAIANKKSGIITLPASDAFGPLLDQARDAGIVTATMYGDGADGSGADINVGIDWTELGKIYVAEVEKLPGDKKLGLIAPGDTGIGKSFMDGVKAAVADTDDVEIVGEVYTGDDSAKALAQTNALLTAHPEVNVIATNMGTVTQGAVSAIEAKGLTGKVAFIGNGPDNGGKEALESGAEYRFLLQALCDAGADALDAVVDRIESGEAAGGSATLIDVGTRMATKDDYAELLEQGWA
ncbi:sugar ABC transporter substrate-binding protein [Herbiconiux sp. A18JL235]|uniref:Sugar ABC transporter substrate-binding protein n=1 Tax=Herbiconiux sp. A18JL235 TaxID=3152363 RepID=A0AB39BFB8_9MICO